MSNSAEEAPPVSVVAAVVASEPESAKRTLAAIEGQVYGPRKVVVVGRAPDLRAFADGGAVEWSASLRAVIESTGPNTTHLWILRAGARPRPGALRALVADSERSGAALAGSKVLDGEAPERLVSVGVATDVFDVAYLGLDEGEMDAGQYDVVRDVAAVDTASFLVRRDLAKGLRGFDQLLAPRAAAIDLSQRARLRAARVVVVPSSEVEHAPSDVAGKPWKEEAGQIRAMLKAYGPLTLLWALPLSFLIGLVEAVVSPLLGRWTLFNWLRAWLWNIVHLLSTLRGRYAARRGDVIGDAELYRYQVRGSVKLRALSNTFTARITSRLGPEERSNIVDFGRDLRRPAFLAGLAAALFVLVATRSIWGDGFPASGYSLPLPASGSDAVAAYAGGWNPGGFGSAEQLPPLIGLAGALQLALFDDPSLTAAVLMVGAFLSGIWGTTKLLRTWDVGPIAGILAGIALIAGPAARGLADDTGVGALLALGALPWTLRVPLLRWPATWRERLGRVASTAWPAAILGLLSPQLLVVPAAALVIWALMNLTDRRAWISAAVAVGGAALAVPTLLPWLDATDLSAYFDRGSAFWAPGLVVTVALGVACVGGVVSLPPRLGLVAGWGGILAASGALLARSGDFGPGRETQHLGMAIAAIGSALIVGTVVEGVRRVVEVTGWKRMVNGAGAAGAVVVAASSLLLIVPGRGGLPSPELSNRIGFVAAAEGDPAASRILLIGPEDVLPGESRTVRGAGYRVVSAPVPEMWEAWLPDMADVDYALEADLEAMIDGDTFRAGEVLAAYGIRWVISLGETPLEAVFGTQLDLVPLGTRRGVAFTAEGDPPVRAVADDGTPWTRTSWGYAGPAGTGRVLLAETADTRWGPDGAAAGPIISVSASDGEARFEAIASRRDQALVAGVLLALLMAIAFLGRRRA